MLKWCDIVVKTFFCENGEVIGSGIKIKKLGKLQAFLFE
jgi:hypothetical protein